MSSSAGGTPETGTITLVNTTKGQAKANCVTTKETDKAGVVTTTDCKLS